MTRKLLSAIIGYLLLQCSVYTTFSQVIFGNNQGCKGGTGGFFFQANCGSAQVNWSYPSTGVELISQDGNILQLRYTAAGNYSISASCGTISASFNVTVGTPPNVSVTASSNTVLEGGQVTLTASGGNTYTWLGNGLTSTSGSQVTAIVPEGQTTYSVSSANTFPVYCAGTASVTITGNPLVNAGPDRSYCKNTGTISLLAWDLSLTEGSWSGAGVTGNTLDLSSLNKGTYTLTYTRTSDGNSDEIVLTVDDLIAGNISTAALDYSCDLVEGNLTIENSNGNITPSSWEFSRSNGVNWSSGLIMPISFDSKTLVRARVEQGTCAGYTQPVTVEPLKPIAGMLNTIAANITCNRAWGTLSLQNYSGDKFTWESIPDLTVPNWQPISGASTDQFSFDVNVHTYYRVKIERVNSGCDAVYSDVFWAKVGSVGGTTSSASNAFCETATGVIHLSDKVGSVIQWEHSTNGTDWSPLSDSDGLTSLPFNTTESINHYRALIQLDNCPAVYSSITTVTVSPATTAGAVRFVQERQFAETINGKLTFYPDFELVGDVMGGVEHWRGTDGTGEAFFPVTTLTFSPTINATTAFDALISNDGCPSVYSGKATFVINKLFEGVIQVLNQTILTEYDGHSYTVANAEGLSIQDGFSFHANSGQEFFVLTDENYSLPSSNENFVMKQEILQEGITNENDTYFLNAFQSSMSFTYLDDLGRVKQEVAKKASPNQQDFVKVYVYDQFGREFKDFLPYEHASNDGRFKTSADQGFFYANEQEKYVARSSAPHSSFIYEASPVNNIIEVAAPGEDWQLSTGRTTKNDFKTNVDNTVLRWEMSDNGLPVFQGESGTSRFYNPGELSVEIQTDEHGVRTREYFDKQGLLVLKEVEENNGWIQTYYVYDDLQRLKCIMQPEGVARLTGNPDEAFLEKWSFRFRHDHRGRVIEKIEPGAKPKYIVYDNRNRPVLFQDGNMRRKNHWYFIKYDRHNRVILTGLYDATLTSDPARIVSRTEISNKVSTSAFYEVYNGQAPLGYTTNLVFPTENLTVLSVNYYDNYDFKSLFGAGYDFDGQLLAGMSNAHSVVTSLLTGSQVRIVGTDLWQKNISYFDDQLRPIQVISDNNVSGKDYISQLYDFNDNLLKQALHHQNGVTTHSVIEEFTYDHTGRMLKRYHTLDGGTKIELAANNYNRLGQVIEKNLHGTAMGYIQSVDFRYNIRGWLTHINNGSLTNDGAASNDDANDFFGLELKYNQPTLTSSIAQYNGNISEITWKGAGSDKQAYSYEYDRANRLKRAIYFDLQNSTRNNRFNEIISAYDKNGNILSLNRNGLKDTPLDAESIFGAMDNLQYTYAGNQLLAVDDMISTTTEMEGGFKDKNKTGNDYSYDDNGNLTSDKNKEIALIEYNHMNLPTAITRTNGDVIMYTYNASGVKLSQTNSKTNVRTDYAGIFHYENNDLKYVQHAEGRVVIEGGDSEYQYFIRDHLGNVRLTFSSKNKTEEALATLENANAANESGKFLYYDEAVKVNYKLFDHSHLANPSQTTYYSTRLNGSDNERIGLAKSIAVMPGDTIRMEVFAKYLDIERSNWSEALENFILAIAGGPTQSGDIIDGGLSGSTGGVIPPVTSRLDKDGDTGLGPKAYLNYLIFDKDFRFLNGGFVRMTDAAKEDGSGVNHERLSKQIVIHEAGYVYTYLSNDNAALGAQQVDVFFDDFKVEQVKSLVVQTDDFYPYGLQATSTSRENTLPNKFLFNGGSELNSSTGLYETMFRHYDPVLGRFNSIDPMASIYDSWSPYNFAFNDPVFWHDPSGLSPISIEGNTLVIDWGEVGAYGGTWTSSGGWTAFTSQADAAGWALDNFGSLGATEQYAVAKLLGVKHNRSWVHDKFSFKWTSKKGSNISFEYLGDGMPSDPPTIKIIHGDFFDLIIETTTQQTSTGERDIKRSALILYDEHGDTKEIILKEEVEEWNLMGWYQGKNPQRRSRPLSISDLSPEMLKSMVESSDYHCQGCILGPVMVKIDGWKPNRMTATSSGSNSKHKNMQHPTKKKPKSQPPVYRKPGSKRPVQKQSDLKLRRDL